MIRTERTPFLSGATDALPFLLVVVPFGVLFGVVATEAGLSVAEAMAMTTVVIAGAAQFSAVQLMTEQAPTLIVIATALAVNLRMAIYSAAMVPHIGRARGWQKVLIGYTLFDQTYALAIAKYEDAPDLTLQQKLRYFAGVAIIVAPMWVGASYGGAKLGARIPEAYALDFALPICFIALVAPALKTRAHVAAALVSILGALALAWVPYSLGLLVAAACAMMTGVAVERWEARQA